MTENNKKFGAASKLTPPPTPRTPRAAESIAECAEPAGRRLLLLLVPVENHNNNNNNNPAQGRRLTPSFYPAPPREAKSFGENKRKMLLAVKDGKNEKMFGAGTKQDNMLALKQRRAGRARGELGGEKGATIRTTQHSHRQSPFRKARG